jgi:hypothetical protein
MANVFDVLLLIAEKTRDTAGYSFSFSTPQVGTRRFTMITVKPSTGKPQKREIGDYVVEGDDAKKVRGPVPDTTRSGIADGLFEKIHKNLISVGFDYNPEARPRDEHSSEEFVYYTNKSR